MADEARGRSRAVAGILAGCGAALALVTVPAQAEGSTPVAATITTLAGGVGRPAHATQIAFRGREECDNVQFAQGHLYIGDEDSSVVRAIDTRTDALTTPAGDGGLVWPSTATAI